MAPHGVGQAVYAHFYFYIKGLTFADEHCDKIAKNGSNLESYGIQ
jgi:hypothetical protein